MSYLKELADTIRANVSSTVDVPGNSDDLFLIYAVLLEAKGDDVTAEDVHHAWVAWLESRGERHRSMVPFDELSADTQEQDLPFAEAIRRTAREMLPPL